MARGRAANGSGMQPRQRKDGLWEVRYCAGTDPGTGKPNRKSLYGKTSAEVAEKLRAVTASVDAGTYLEPQRMPLGDWLEYGSMSIAARSRPVRRKPMQTT